MPLPAPPDLARPRWRLWASALAVTVIAAAILVVRDARGLAGALGDTDDAMRLVLVRELLNGQGWWAQHLYRLQPPVGVYMHWSRLLDGGIALMERGFALFTDWQTAEWLTRLVWPLLWIFPSALAALSLADEVGRGQDAEGRATAPAPGAVLVCAFFLVSNFALLYIQYHPGRVDHHDVQMSCCFLALAGAAQTGSRRVRGAVLAGAATGLGLAIGLEALVFEALIGAAIALRFVFDETQAKPLRAYGLALAGTTLAAFCIQTPPWRWGVSACDALALNACAAVVLAGLAVAAASAVARLRRGGMGTRAIRFSVLAVAGLATAGVYLGLDPHCLRGPFADVDPAIKTLWLVHVKEMQPWPTVLRTKPQEAISYATAPILGTLALLWLARRSQIRRQGAFRLTAGVFAAGAAAGFSGVRLCGYADWIAMPLIAVAAADVAQGLARRHRWAPLIPLVVCGLVLTPVLTASAAWAVDEPLTKAPKPQTGKPPTGKPGTGKPGTGKTGVGPGAKAGPPGPAQPPKPPADHCFATRPYRALAAAGPPGLVLSEIDLGPFVLAATGDSVLAAPYHRMSWGMLAARSVLAADADHGAEARARALGVTYVLECPVHANHTDRIGLSPGSLQKRLDRGGPPPAWLERADAPDAVLQVFRVRPPAATAAGQAGRVAPAGRAGPPPRPAPGGGR